MLIGFHLLGHPTHGSFRQPHDRVRPPERRSGSPREELDVGGESEAWIHVPTGKLS